MDRGGSGEPAPWHLWVDEEPRPGWANMAIDLTLLDRAEESGESWLRLYRWNPHCLSFGRHEPATHRYDVERIIAWGLDTVRRPTGGRAVWHGRELTYAVAAPSYRFGSLREAYHEIHAMLRNAVEELGARASLAPPRGATPVSAGACFCGAAGGEVMVGRQKIVGSAQLRRVHAFLQHGSILLEEDQRILLGLSRGACDSAAASPLALLLGRPLEMPEVIAVVTAAAAQRWSGVWQRSSDPGRLLGAAVRYFPQFRSPAWTWAR